MPTVNALQHIFSSVERGYFARQGRGFQTVAVAPELVGTDDLRVLEDAAFYALSSDRREVGDSPVKETFFRLPSGRFAVGRTVGWGTDSLGREGNYLTHHLIVSRDELLAVGAQPLSLIDAARLARADTDMTARELPPLTLEVRPTDDDLRGLAGFNLELLANLVAAAVGGGEKTALLVGDEARSRVMLRGLFTALAKEERLRLTFSTYFYQSHHVRPLFAFAAVRSRADAPSQGQEYTVFGLDDNEFPHVSPTNAYAEWLTNCLLSARWEEIHALNVTLNRLRSGGNHQGKDFMPRGARACAALWERAGTKVAQALVGDAKLVVEFLHHLRSPRPLAESLLAAAAPSQLCGASPTPELTDACLSALYKAVSRKNWLKWARRWKDDPALALFLPKTRRWWQIRKL